MPTIKIFDEAGVELEVLSTQAGPGSGIDKYFKGDVAGFIAASQLATALTKSIATLGSEPLGLGLRFKQSGSFGTSGVDWKLNAGQTVSVVATQEGKTIPGDELFAEPIKAGSGTTFLSTAFTPALSVGLSDSVGDLSFGFSAGGSVTFRAGRPFGVTESAPSLGEALKELLREGIVPANIVDLTRMKEGDVGSVAGMGELKLSAKFNLARMANPLASPSIPFVPGGKVEVMAGGKLQVGASASLKGHYQIRIQKKANDTVRVGFYKMKGSQFDFDVKASVGVEANLGGTDLLARLLGMLGSPRVNVVDLVDAGLSNEQIKSIQKAIEASLSRSLAVSLAGSFSALAEDSKVFEYEFDLNHLGAEGLEALQQALRADLSLLTERDSDELPAGVRMLVSEVDRVRKRSMTWKINFFGIVNVLRIHELIRTGKVLFNPTTGELVVTDAVTAKELTVSTRPFEADEKKIHKVLLQNFMATAAYRASGIGKLVEFSGSMSYFEQVGTVKRANVADFLDNFVGAKLISDGEKEQFLAQPFSGKASVYLDCVFESSDFDAMFFDEQGKPFEEEHYERIGRDCVAQIVREGDENDFRRTPMLPANDAMWAEMRVLGPNNLQRALPPELREPVPLANIRHDYLVISWWAAAMSSAAERVVEMRDFLAQSGGDAESLKDDKEFLKRRKRLGDALEGMVSRALPDFLDAWGVLAMYSAAKEKPEIRGVLVTTGPVLVKASGA